MGAGDRVVGVSSYDHYPPEVDALPRVGGLLDPNIERLLALRPDLVIVVRHADRARGTGSSARGDPDLPRTSIAACPTSPETIRALGARIGSGRRGRPRWPIAHRGAHLAADPRARRRPAETRKRCSCSDGRRERCGRSCRERRRTGSCTTCSSRRRRRCARRLVTRESVQMSTEMLLARAARASSSSCTTAPSCARTDRGRGAPRLEPAAVGPRRQNSRVYLLDGDEFVVPGPRVADAAERLARDAASGAA